VETLDLDIASQLPAKRQKKGLPAAELMKPSQPDRSKSYIAQKFSAGAVVKNDENDDRLVGLISVEDRELLALAEKNQYVALQGSSVPESTAPIPKATV